MRSSFNFTSIYAPRRVPCPNLSCVDIPLMGTMSTFHITMTMWTPSAAETRNTRWLLSPVQHFVFLEMCVFLFIYIVFYVLNSVSNSLHIKSLDSQAPYQFHLPKSPARSHLRWVCLERLHSHGLGILAPLSWAFCWFPSCIGFPGSWILYGPPWCTPLFGWTIFSRSILRGWICRN